MAPLTTLTDLSVTFLKSFTVACSEFICFGPLVIKKLYLDFIYGSYFIAFEIFLWQCSFIHFLKDKQRNKNIKY